MRKTMATILKLIFATILLSMVAITVMASIDQSISKGVTNLWPNWWFKATLADAYFGFLTVFVWVAYKELHLWRQLLWFAAFMLLGTMAIASYILLELFKLKEGDTVEILLTRRNG